GPATSTTESCCMTTFALDENWRLTPPAHLPVDCDPSVSLSTSTTFAPRRARWYAMEHPTTPPPTTTASAESLIITGTTLCSGMGSGGETGRERPLYGPSDRKVSPRFSGIRTYARLPHVTGRLEGVDAAI